MCNVKNQVNFGIVKKTNEGPSPYVLHSSLYARLSVLETDITSPGSLRLLCRAERWHWLCDEWLA